MELSHFGLLLKFADNGLSDEKFPIHSCKFRWNNKNSDLFESKNLKFC